MMFSSDKYDGFSLKRHNNNNNKKEMTLFHGLDWHNVSTDA